MTDTEARSIPDADKPRIKFDMDGTLADYDAEMIKRLSAMMSPSEIVAYVHSEDEPPYIKARRDAVSADPRFWRNLQEVELGTHIWAAAQELGFFRGLLTQGPSSSPAAWMAKVEWAQERFGRDIQITITRDKSDTYARVLVEDFPPYIIRWLAHRPRGLVVLIDQPHNRDFSHPQVIRYVGTNLEEVKTLMRRARDRKSGEPL